MPSFKYYKSLYEYTFIIQYLNQFEKIITPLASSTLMYNCSMP